MFNFFFGQGMNTFWGAIGAVGTVLAFAVALGQLVNQSKYKNRLLEMEQASEVSGWLVDERPNISEEEMRQVNGIPSSARLNNNSSLPIYNVFLLSSHLRASENPMDMGISHYKHFDIVAPGEKNIIVMTGGSGAGDHPALAMLFSDSKGITWLRTPKGLLIKMKKEMVNEFLMVYKIGGGPYGNGQSVEAGKP